MQLLASYPYLNLYLHEGASRAIEAEWKGFISSPVLRQATREAVALAQQHCIAGWIADDRLLGPVRPSDLEWIVANVLPQLVEVGLQRFARMEAIDPMNKMLIGQVQETAQQQMPFELRSFTDIAEARAWACG